MARPRIRLFRRLSSSGRDAEAMSEADEREMTSGDDELLARLQRMEWPKAPPELRERCWREISRRISEMEAEGGLKPPAEGGQPPRDEEPDIEVEPGSAPDDAPAGRPGDEDVKETEPDS